MVEIYPKLTQARLKKSARKTSEGKGAATLPGVKTDAKQAATADLTDPKSPFYGAIYCDPKGYGRNRKLAERISNAVRELKKTDEHGPRFVLAWRLYPNDDHPCWHRKDVHFCGCGCGCFARGEREHPRKRSRAIKRSRRTREK
jgi:hypothetical protein